MNSSALKEKILEFARSQNITEGGVAPCGEGCALVFLFPYFCGECRERNISLYACAPDYHKTVMKYLSGIEEYIHTLCPEAKTKCYADIGPERDKSLALSAGLGVQGQNTLLINKKYGSFVFIGYIETDMELPCDLPLEDGCEGCGACRRACPGGALEDTFCVKKCASFISQKRGELTAEEKERVKKSGLIWGCDTCQTVCPMNKDIEHTPLPEFKENILCRLDEDKIRAMTNKEFENEYSCRAFSWRGKKVLLRNMGIKNEQ